MALAALILGIFSIALGLLPLLPLGGPALLTLAAVGLPLGIVAFGLGLVSRSGALRAQVDRQPQSRDGSRDRQGHPGPAAVDRQGHPGPAVVDRQGRPGPAAVDLSLCTAALSAAVVGTLLCAAWIGAVAYMQHRVHQAAERCRRDPARCLRGSDDASDEGKPPAGRPDAPAAGRPAAPPARERDAGAGRTL